jgi:hypothetical protein
MEKAIFFLVVDDWSYLLKSKRLFELLCLTDVYLRIFYLVVCNQWWYFVTSKQNFYANMFYKILNLNTRVGNTSYLQAVVTTTL